MHKLFLYREPGQSKRLNRRHSPPAMKKEIQRTITERSDDFYSIQKIHTSSPFIMGKIKKGKGEGRACVEYNALYLSVHKSISVIMNRNKMAVVC